MSAAVIECRLDSADVSDMKMPSSDDVTGKMAWEDSGIIIGGSGALTPEYEPQQQQQQQPAEDGRGLDAETAGTDERRRCSAGTYSLSSEEADETAAGGHADAVEFCGLGAAAASDQHQQPSVGSSPGYEQQPQQQQHSDDQQKSQRQQRPRVDFQRGIRCSEAVRAIEILLTNYKLRSSWAYAANGGGSGRGMSRDRRHDDANANGSPQLRPIQSAKEEDTLRKFPEIVHQSVAVYARRVNAEVCVEIERRHMELAELVRKLLELDAANKAEAAALMRLSAAEPALSPADGTKSGSSTLDSTDGAQQRGGTSSSDGLGGGASRPLKRRNPFSRAVSALRKKFARPQQQQQQQGDEAAVPAAA